MLDSQFADVLSRLIHARKASRSCQAKTARSLWNDRDLTPVSACATAANIHPAHAQWRVQLISAHFRSVAPRMRVRQLIILRSTCFCGGERGQRSRCRHGEALTLSVVTLMNKPSSRIVSVSPVALYNAVGAA